MESRLSAPLRFASFEGRSRESSFLQQRTVDAREDRGSMVLIAGAAGIGKSRLVRECSTDAQAQGFHIGVGRSRDYSFRRYAPFADVVEALELAAEEPVLRTLSTGHPATTFPAFIRALTERARSQRVLLVLEDMHWADRESLDLLEYLNDAIDDGPVTVLVLATFRTDDIAYDATMDERLARFERSACTYRIDLGSLDASAIDTLLYEATGTHTLPVGVHTRIRDVAQGNPFYAEELLRVYVERGEGALAELPRSLGAAVLLRFHGLTPNAQRIVSAAAALGRSFDVISLAELVTCRGEELRDALAEAAHAALVLEAPHKPDDWAFAHPVIHEAIHGALLPFQARALHRTIMELYRVRDPDDVARLAYHAFEAHEQEAILEYGEAAGDRAMAAYAFHEATLHFGHALESSCIGHRRTAQILQKCARAFDAMNESAKALEAAQRSASILNRENAQLEAAAVLLEASRYAYNCGDSATLNQLDEQTDALMRETAAPQLLFRRHVAFATYRALSGHAELAAAALEKAESLSYEKTPIERQRMLRAHAAILALRFDARWIEEARAAVACVDPSKELLAAFSTHVVLTQIALMAGDMEYAQTMAAAAYDLAKEQNVPGWIGGAAAQAALVCCYRGELPSARRYSAEALLLAPSYGMANFDAVPAALLSATLSGEEALAERVGCKDLLERVLSSGSGIYVAMVAYAFSEKMAADRDRSAHEALLDRALPLLQSAVGAGPLLVHAAAYGSKFAVAAARRWIESLPRVPGTLPDAFAQLFNAECLRRGGHSPAGLAVKAAALFQRIGMPYFEARARELAGDTQGARQMYRRIGDVRDERRLSGRRTKRNGHGPELTSREHEVALLAARGRTTPEIAETLVVSRRTIETHLEAIYRKYGIKTRSALASIVVGP